MFTDLLQFTRERFPLKVVVPLSAVLFAAPGSLARIAVPEAAFGFFNTVLFLLLLRMQDDLSDMHVDRITHPERGLVSGRINPRNVRKGMLIGIGLILALNLSAHLFLPVFAMTLGYVIFYALKERIALPLHPILVNVLFFFIPLYACFIATGRVEWPYILLGLFIWTAVIAHDFAHSVHGPDESPAEVPTVSKILGPRGSAVTALCTFVVAGLIGCFFWNESGRPVLFIIFLAGTFLAILFLGIRLIRDPVVPKAKPFYIFGFVFFLLPLLGLIVDTYLNLKR